MGRGTVTTTVEDKKKELLNHLSDAISQGKLLSLSPTEVKKSLADGEFTAEEIEDIIDNLKESNRLRSTHIRTDLLYPRGTEEQMEEWLSAWQTTITDAAQHMIGWIILGGLLTVPWFFNVVADSVNFTGTAEQLIRGSAIGAIGMLGFGYLFRVGYERTEDFLPYFQENRALILPTGGLPLIVGAVMLILQTTMPNLVSMNSVWIMVAGSLTAGAAIGIARWRSKSES